MTSRNQRGSVTVFVVSMTTALLLVAGLVLDGGRIISARRDADAVAGAAARAGAQAIDEAGLRQSDSAPIDATGAANRVQRYLATTAFTGTATVTGESIVVEVTRTQDLSILSLVGLRSSAVTGNASARTARAVRGDP